MWIIFEFVHINYVIASDSVAISSCSILKWFNTAHCRRGYYFCRNKSNKNAFFFLGLFAAQGLCPANQSEPQAAKSCSTSFAHRPPLQQIFAMPFATLKATIVLPDFVRSELHLSEPEFSEFFTS
jgi:hypothetical protein